MKNFKILHTDGKARAGQLVTPHGIIETPSFNPVGTQATVKALGPRELEEIGVQIVLANTYHLSLRPGADLIEKLGGLHKFMNWNHPIMTDSGGFQVFSLGAALEHGDSKVLKRIKNHKSRIKEEKSRPRLNKITEEGVVFQSHLDGSKHTLTPESSIQIQRQLGADLIVAFDDHESSKHSHGEMLKSIELTERWELRSLEEFNKKDDNTQMLYGVVHGGTHQDLRIRSAQFTDQYFNAIAIGGIYEDRKNLCHIIEWVTGVVSEDKPRHLLGIGEVEDLFNGIERGIDFFDCVAPTRRARNGSLYVSPNSGVYRSVNQYRNSNFTVNIRASRFTKDKKPIDPTCRCLTCKNFSRAYLHHLYACGEILYHQLATYHNVYFITNLVKDIEEAIKKGKFKDFKKVYLGK